LRIELGPEYAHFDQFVQRNCQPRFRAVAPGWPPDHPAPQQPRNPPMTKRHSLTALLLAGTALSSAFGIASGAELPVRGVTLSSAGLAQIERGGDVVPGDPEVTFHVPLGDVDDILRSLIVADPAGRVEGLRLPAQDLAADAFRGLPVGPDHFASRASLSNALRGERFAIGDAEGPIADASEGEEVLRLTIVTATGLRSLMLREHDELRFLDTGIGPIWWTP